MQILTIFLMSLFVAGSAQAEWVGPNKKHSFPQSFPAGREADGRPLYISQCVLRETTFGGELYYSTKNHGWHIGKAGVHLKDGMTFPYGGKEFDSEHCRHDEHWVFVPDAGVSYSWVPSSGGSFPNGAVKGFNGAEQHRVCRVHFNGGIHPGKLIPSSSACFIGWGGREHGIQNYEVLVRN